jgi:hypothetical protein
MDAKALFSDSRKGFQLLSSKLVLFLLFAAALFSFIKGLSPISIAGEPYWVINYGDGLIRRGLLGQIFSFFADQHDLDLVLRAALLVHITACMLLLIGLWSWLRILLNSGSDGILLAIFGIFATSQFFGTQALTAGFLDIYIYIIVFLAAIAIVRKWYVTAAIISFVGPFVHEGFIFWWLTLVVLVLWEGLTLQRLLVLLSPLVATVIVYFSSAEAAAIAQMAKAPLNPHEKELLLLQLSQTIRSNFEFMLFKRYEIYFHHFLIASGLFMPPAAVMICTYASNRRSYHDIFAFVTASLAPAIVVFFASDLSRFMVLIYFSALLSVFYMQTIRPAVVSSTSVLVVCWTVSALGLLSPLVYADFDQATIVDNGIIPSKALVFGKAMRPLLYSPQNISLLPTGSTMNNR